MLKAKSRFHHYVIKFGKGLHLSEKEFLSAQSEVASMQVFEEWDRWYQQAQHFYTIANYAFSQQLYSQAVFLYHQSVEHTCTALLRFFTGYHSTTHNIGQLLTMTESFTNSPRAIFPGTTKEEAEIINILIKAYSESRYKESYDIAPGMIEVIKQRVKALLLLADGLNKKGLKSLDDPTTLYLPTLKPQHVK